MIAPGEKPFSFLTRFIVRVWPGMHLFSPTYNISNSPIRKHYLAWASTKYNDLSAGWVHERSRVARVKRAVIYAHYRIMCRFWIA